VAEAREDIEDLLREGALEGVGEASEIEIISGLVTFGEKTVEQVMTRRDEVFAVDADLAPLEMARRIAQAAYSRVPVYRGTLDTVVGIVLAFDVFKERGETVPEVRKVAETDPATRCNELLFSMLRHRLHFAVVKDSAGRTAGIVTLEDLLEELVGDIRDEHDEPPSRPGSAAA
jgi:CBS domain containing-hemolysin-like protein